jgi:hypothetical protein
MLRGWLWGQKFYEGWLFFDGSFIFYFFFLDQPGRYLDRRLGDKGALDWDQHVVGPSLVASECCRWF